MPVSDVPHQPHMSFVTHFEIDQLFNTVIQPLADQVAEAISVSGQKDNRMDILWDRVGEVLDTQNAHSTRFQVLEDRVTGIEARVGALESTVADQQEQIDALALLFS